MFPSGVHNILQITRAVKGQVPAAQVLGTGRYRADELQQAPGWLAEIDAFAGEIERLIDAFD